MILDTFNWLTPIIGSCINIDQLDICQLMVGLFKVKYKHDPDFAPLYDKLLGQIASKEALLKVS